MYRVLKPHYLQLAVLVAVVAGLFVAINFFWQTSDQTHVNFNMLVLLCGYGAFQLWLAMNSGAIQREKENRRDEADGLAPAVNAVQLEYRRAARRRTVQLYRGPRPELQEASAEPTR